MGSEKAGGLVTKIKGFLADEDKRLKAGEISKEEMEKAVRDTRSFFQRWLNSVNPKRGSRIFVGPSSSEFGKKKQVK